VIKKHYTIYVIFLLLTFGICAQEYSVLGQQATNTINYDEGIELAHRLAIEGKYEVARLLCQRILKDVPHYADAYIIIGNTYAWTNHLTDARLFYYKVFEYENGNFDAFSQLITIDLWEGKAESAINLANKALRYHPQNSDLLIKKARAYIMIGDYYSAKKSLFIVLDKNPNDQEARNLYSSMIRGIPNEISLLGNKVLSLSPVDTIFKQAQNYAWNQEFDNSNKLILQILDVRPDYFPAKVLLAQTYAWQNEFSKARLVINSLDLAGSNYREGITTAIDIELWANDYGKAIKMVDSLALNYFPDDREYLFKKADIYRTQGNIYKSKNVIYQLLLADPLDSQAIQYYNELRSGSLKDNKNYWAEVQADSRRRGFDAEATLHEARELSYIERFEEAQALCLKVLEVYPDNYEAHFLLGVTMAWLEQYEYARQRFAELIKTNFDSYELIEAMVNLETWDHNYKDALDRVNYGLQIYPNDKEYLLKRAGILERMGETDLAATSFSKLMEDYPDDKEIKKSFYYLKGLIQLNAVGAEYTFNTYDIPERRTWQMYSAKYYHSNDIGTFIGSLNTGYFSPDTSRFAIRGGYQFVIDAFPIFSAQKRYFHFSYGYSPSMVLARHRFGAYIYQEIVSSWELSAGFTYARYINTDGNPNVNVFVLQTGISKYWSGFMGSFVASFAPTATKLSQGYTLIGRKFLGRPDNWIQIAASVGVFPENPGFYLNDALVPIGELPNSYTIYGGARYKFGKRMIGRIYLGYQRQEYLSELRNAWSANFALIYLLKDED